MAGAESSSGPGESNVTITETYEQRHRRSAERHAQASTVFPDGVTADARYFTPFAVHVTRALGSHKWDADGHEIVDYLSGHGALLLGHGRPEVVQAVQEQVARGTHYGASHELEIEWARRVQRLIPSAERVRFTSSGTEAVQLALRLARAATGRELVVKFGANFHGWSDAVAARRVNGRIAPAPGVPQGVLDSQIVLPQNDTAALHEAFNEHGRRIAAVLVEPTGAMMAAIPIDVPFLHELRRVTEQTGTVLIFDEVVTGFRVSPGGAQALYGVRPDLTTLAKILAGGLPGGAVVGRAQLLDQIAFLNDDGTPRAERVSHPGTFNANPLSAAAGIAALDIIATGEPQRQADATALRLSAGINRILRRRGIPGCAYGQGSIITALLGAEVLEPDDGITWRWPTADHSMVPFTALNIGFAFRRAMLNEGVDIMGMRLIVSAAHSDADVEWTLAAFERALSALEAEDLLRPSGNR